MSETARGGYDLSEVRKLAQGEIQDTHIEIVSRDEPDATIFAIPPGFAVRNHHIAGNDSRSGGTYNGPPGRIAGAVSLPTLVHQVQPQYTVEARAAKLSGDVLVNFLLDTQGVPQNVRVIRGVGKGLDQKAAEAVKQYRFKPAMQDGKPIAMPLNIEVRFQIY